MNWEITLLVNIGIGLVIVGLVKHIFTREKGLLMSKEQHLKDCTSAQDKMESVIKKEFVAFKDHFDLEMENKVLKSLHNLNGTLEQKIADVVATQVVKLGGELTKKIDEKLSLVKILEKVVTKE